VARASDSMTEVELEDDDTVTVIDSANNYRRSYHADPEGCQSVPM